MRLINLRAFSNWELMRTGQPGVPTEDDWLVSSTGAELKNGLNAFYIFPIALQVPENTHLLYKGKYHCFTGFYSTKQINQLLLY